MVDTNVINEDGWIRMTNLTIIFTAIIIKKTISSVMSYGYYFVRLGHLLHVPSTSPIYIM